MKNNFTNWPIIKEVIKGCNPNVDKKSTGGIMLILSVAGMISAAVTNTFAAAVDKNTSAEDKKFLVPAGAVTGVANIGLYYMMTDKMIKGLEKSAKDQIDNLKKTDNKAFLEKATLYTKSIVSKAETGFMKTGLFKKSPEYIKTMKATLFENGDTAKNITQYAQDLYSKHVKSGAGVLGAFAGAVIGCSFLTPIIRDVSAWAIQKVREKNAPQIEEKPLQTIDVSSLVVSPNIRKQPLSMKSYMTQTSGSNLKI